MAEQVPDELVEIGAQVLRDSAYQCDGACGLNEQDCYQAHPVNWAGTVAGETHVQGEAPDVVRVVLAATTCCIKARAIRELAAEAELKPGSPWVHVAGWLRRRADEIERGESDAH